MDAGKLALFTADEYRAQGFGCQSGLMAGRTWLLWFAAYLHMRVEGECQASKLSIVKF